MRPEFRRTTPNHQKFPSPPRHLAPALVLLSYFDNLAQIGWGLLGFGLPFVLLLTATEQRADEPFALLFVLPAVVGACLAGYAALRARRRVRLLRFGHWVLGTLKDRQPTIWEVRGFSATTTDTVYRLIFEFNTGGGPQQVTHLTHVPDKFADPQHPILYDLHDPAHALVLNAVAVRPRIAADGSLLVHAGEFARLVLPLLVAVLWTMSFVRPW